ncbi:binding protein isoform X2 [Wolffia australiana]
MAEKLEEQVRNVGLKLENLAVPKDAIIELLNETANCLAKVGQSPSPSMAEAMKACVEAIPKSELFKHEDKEVSVLVATCLCEITRITAPEAPYSDDVLKDIFRLIVSTFNGLADEQSPSFERIVGILETLARYRSCIVMLDLDCNDLIQEMFSTFFTVVSHKHKESIIKSMQTIMLLILDESEDIPENLLSTILSVLGEKADDSTAARKLAMNIIERCAAKLEPSLKQFLISIMSGDDVSSSATLDHHAVIHNIYTYAPQILNEVIPYITGELLTDQLDVRVKAVRLIGNMFSSSEKPISESFRPLFSEFLKRLNDRVLEVRVSVVEHLKKFLISDPSRPEAPDIIAGLCDRLLDYDEQVRVKVVETIFDVAAHKLTAISSQTIKGASERLRDKSLTVKKYAMERLGDLYKRSCSMSSDQPVNGFNFEWIPGKILRCLYDRDFRSEDIELILCVSLFPPEFTVKERAKHWVKIFSGFDKTEVKALEQILTQKRRLQQEMQKYLSCRQMCQENEVKKISGSFRIMSRLFSDPLKAEESFQTLNQLKDADIWKIFGLLCDPCTNSSEAWESRAELLKILGDNHDLSDFLAALSVRCSYLLFNKEYIREILSLAVSESGDAKFISSCMNLLPILASFCPLLLEGFEEELVHLLKEDNDVIKEGVAHILAKAGGTIREQLARTSSSVELLLEGLCLEGTRRQAKYSVQALASITEDDGLKSLSVLYKRLVDMLEEKTHLPAILQSLGCIAQTAMPIFETRENEIVEFILHNILECSTEKTQRQKKHDDVWTDRSEVCSLKIFALKTLVRSYMPAKDALLRTGIEKLLGILKNVLSFGEISNSIKSSAVDKSHLRLASAKAILRLSRLWETKIPVDIFELTLGTSQDSYPQCRKIFLSKVHQYIKERHLDPKYTCAFFFNFVDSEPNGSLEPNLLEIFQVCYSVKARQVIVQSDASLLSSYPEYVLVYLVHSLAHHPKFPDGDKFKRVQQFEPFYRRLHLFLSVLLQGSESFKSNDKNKRTLSVVVSIFQCIKLSEDVVSKEKSKSSYALCDIGLFIVKHLSDEQADFEAPTKPVTLPEQLYKTVATEDNSKEGNVSEKWAHRDEVLAHFESLEQAKDEKAVSIDQDQHSSAKESDDDGNELPLGEIMKMYKSQGAKKRKMAERLAGVDSSENIDVMGMVREINMDNRERMPIVDEGKKESPFSLPHVETKATPSPSKVPSGSSQEPTPTRKSVEGANGRHVGLSLRSKSSDLATTSSAVQKQSFGGLEKCSSGKSRLHGADLVGCKIKVWWPMDKKYYRGRVSSYDPGKKKHTVVYDDGDIEVLLLQKESWELIESDQPSKKKLKSRHSPSSEEPSPTQIMKKKGFFGKSVRTKKEQGMRKTKQSPRSDPDSSKSKSRIDPKTRTRSGKDSPVTAKEGEDSENEPLNVWRRRAAKSG